MDEQIRKDPESAALIQAAAGAPGERRDRLERMIQAAQEGKGERKAFCAAKAPSKDSPDCHEGAAPSQDAPPSWGGWKGRRGRPGPEPRRRRPMGRFARKLAGTAIALALLIAVVLIFWPRVQQALTPDFRVDLPDSLEGLLPDETMGYNSVDFSNAILGESREQKELVVMEQDVEVTSQVTQDLLNISLFSKQKIIHSFGTGVYTVDLNDLTPQDIVLNEATFIITVAVPHAKLSYVSVDVDKTEFEDTKKALLAVGDIKLTAEQQQVLNESVDAALNQRLSDPALLAKADEIALNKVRELFQAAISAISQEHIVKIVMK